MPAENIIERAFSGGELAPALYARVDHSKYQTGLRTARNLICMRHGGVTQRPGTMFVGSALNGAAQVRLIPFIFNETGLGQSYVLEFGNQYIAFWQNGAPVTTTGAAFNIFTFYGLGSYATYLGVVYISLQGPNVGNIPASSPTFWRAQSQLQIFTPYLQADLATLDFAESADVLTIVHPNYAPRELTRVTSTNWTLTKLTNWGSNLSWVTAVAFNGSAGGGLQPQYYIAAVNAKGQESDAGSPNYQSWQPGAFPSAGPFALPTLTTPVNISWTPVVGAVSYRIYVSRISNVFGFIGEVLNPNFSDTGQTADFTNLYPQYVQIFGDDGSGFCPSHVGFSQQRRYFANTINNQIGFWGSQPGAYSNFDTHITSQDDDAIIGQVAGEEVNSIQHILELKFMLMLTAGAELFVQGNGSGVVTPSAINASVQSQYGSSPLRPIKAGDVVLFNQSLGNFIRDLAFDFVIDGYRGNDLTIFSAHLFEGHQIVDWAYQKIPDSILWAVREDGVLLSLTYVREQQILAWTRHDFDNGVAGNINTPPASVENVVCIPENGNYAVYLSIKRSLVTGSVRYIERMSQRIWQSPSAAVTAGTAVALGDPIDATYLDCYSKYDGRNTDPSFKMALNSQNVYIDTNVNDGISMREQLLANTQLEAIIPPGSYTRTGLATAVGVAMTAAGTQTYVGTLVGGKINIQCNGGAGSFIMDFTSAAPNAKRNAGLSLGFAIAVYTVSGNITAPSLANFSFSSGPSAYQQQIILTSSSPYFGVGQTAQAGDQIFLEDTLWVSSAGQQGNQIRCTIQSVTDSTDAVVTPDRAVPAEFQGANIAIWARAVNQVTGLGYLEHQFVSIWADRYMVASALRETDSNLAVYSVQSGQLEVPLPNYYSVIYIGLPMTADFETLAIDTSFGDALLGDTKLISSVIVYLYNARGFWGGTQNPDTDPNNPYLGGINDPLFGLTENKAQGNRQFYDSPPSLLTDWQITTIECNWSKEGRIFIRNVDPVPLSILAVVPAGLTSAKVAWSQKV